MIIFDGVHLASDSSEGELHAFAKKVGLKRTWYQSKRELSHYDVLGIKKARVIAAGAELVSNRELIKRLRARSKRTKRRTYKIGPIRPAKGKELDGFGALLGVSRAGRKDAEYRQALIKVMQRGAKRCR